MSEQLATATALNERLWDELAREQFRRVKAETALSALRSATAELTEDVLWNVIATGACCDSDDLGKINEASEAIRRVIDAHAASDLKGKQERD